jgi:hypothetical protein
VDIYGTEFLQNIVKGLQHCYASAFNKVGALFVNSKNQRVGSKEILAEDLEIVMAPPIKTTKRNAENNKDVVNLRYYVVDRSTGKIVPPTYAADSINKLNEQEMAKMLEQEVETKGYVEVMPRGSTTQDNQLWIIGAVLGPLLFLCIVFWLILFIYYKCINPRTNLHAKTKPQMLKEDPYSVRLFSLLFY